MPRVDLRAAAVTHRVELGPRPPLSPAEARLVASTWRGRMVHEHVSARVYGVLLGQAMAAELDAARQAELLRFAQEELEHARMCAGVLAGLGFEAVGEVAALPEVPAHADAEPLEAFLRNALSVACLSETCATALIARERLGLEGDPLEPVLSRILADEVGHARFGWKLLEDTRRSEALNARLGRYLVTAFAHLERHELRHLSAHAPSAAAMACGACDGEAARAVLYDTIEHVIVPRLEQHGLPAERAWGRRREGWSRPAAPRPRSAEQGSSAGGGGAGAPCGERPSA